MFHQKPPIIAFIGGGNITRCLITGLINNKFDPKLMLVSNPSQDKLDLLVKDFGIKPATSNNHAVDQADIIFLAVKPRIVKSVCEEISSAVNSKKPLIISLATATGINDIISWLNAEKNDLSIIRTMTNTATAVGSGITALYANQYVTKQQSSQCSSIFNAVGEITWVKQESDINLFTPLIGCSPAYLFLLIEAMEKAAITLGIPKELAKQFALNSISGAATLAKQSDLPVEQLRKNVTTPNGATEHSLKPLLEGNFFVLFEEAFKAAEKRCNEVESTLHEEGKKKVPEKN